MPVGLRPPHMTLDPLGIGFRGSRWAAVISNYHVVKSSVHMMTMHPTDTITPI